MAGDGFIFGFLGIPRFHHLQPRIAFRGVICRAVIDPCLLPSGEGFLGKTKFVRLRFEHGRREHGSDRADDG
ncbi:MAG: hypothetical protein ACKOFH_14615, partial [Chthoniobacterales bacterium]